MRIRKDKRERKKCKKWGDSLKNNADLIDHYFYFSTSFSSTANSSSEKKKSNLRDVKYDETTKVMKRFPKSMFN